MAQFDVYENKNRGSRAAFPLLLDVQSDLLDELQTRVVIPLTRPNSAVKKPLSRLTPWLEVNGNKYILVTPQLAGIDKASLGAVVAELSAQRARIIAALDMLITGI